MAIVDGILDFVAGTSHTSLDSIDYDAFYGINAEHSLELYYVLLRATGPFWPTTFGDALEVGCGTGGLSLALFGQIDAQKIVLTDISTKMLRICRERLRQAMPDRTQAFDYATYSGTEHCFRDETFDSCFGTAVVHHIADVPRFLKQVNDLLKPGGFAFFMEPSQAFHRALTVTLAEIIAEFLRSNRVSVEDTSRMLSWVAEVHCNIVNSGDAEILAEREDKHFFDGAVFTEWAREAGFGAAMALPCDLDPSGWGTVQNYLYQCNVSPDGFAALSEVWHARSGRHFDVLASHDQSPSYLFWLRKVTWPEGALRGRLLRPPPPKPVRMLPTEFWLSIGAKNLGGQIEINFSGWCLADIPVASVEFAALDVRQRIPIWLPRPDVQTLVNQEGRYAPLNALCSGFEGVIRSNGDSQPASTIDISFHVICTNGEILEAGTISLDVGDTPDRTYHIAIKP